MLTALPLTMNAIAARQELATRAATTAITTHDHEECIGSAYAAGEMAYRAGMTMDDLDAACPGLLAHSAAWCVAVDGWHDTHEARGTRPANIVAVGADGQEL